MYYTVDLKNPFNRWLVNDRPDVSGTVYKNGTAASNLLGVIIEINRAGGVLISERACTLDSNVSGAFTYRFDSALTQQDRGKIFIKALEDEQITATIDSTITSSSTSVDVTVSSGTVPSDGFCKIGDELIEYTYSSPTVTLGTRGTFMTTATSHNSGDSIAFGRVKETCEPYYDYVVNDVRLL